MEEKTGKEDIVLENLEKEEHKVQRLYLDWKNVRMSKTIESGPFFKKKKEVKEILKTISGSAPAGELLAIMGPSGGGKTSLLNVLSNRAKIKSGSITLNDQKLPKNFNKISAYVMQDDRLFEMLTPRELFTFSAKLRLPRETTNEERKKRVEYVIKKLRMTSCADTRVGGHLMKGLSGGERKRTAIGYELITNPSLLFLDEPTTGLDSFTALALISLLKDLTNEGRTVLCTIHQPSSEIFHLFDRLILLVKGEVAYQGVAKDAIEFFGNFGYQCPTFSNPTDYFMELLETRTEEGLERTQKFVEASKISKEVQQQEESSPDIIEATVVSSVWTQFFELARRNWRTITRNPLSFRARIGQTIVMALLVGIVYETIGTYQVSISNRVGALFFVVMGQVMPGVMSVLLTFPLERSLLIREQSNGMYGVGSYFFGKILSGLPFDIIFPLVYTLITYWFVGFNTTSAYHFFLFFLTVIVLNLTASSFGFFLGCMLPNAEVAVTLAPIMIIPFILFAGFFVKIASIPVWLRWLQYLSLFKWGLEAFLTNEFTGLKFSCLENEYVSVPTPNGPIQVCPVTTGEQVLTNMGYNFPDDYWIAIGVLAGLYIAFISLAFIFLKVQTKKSVKKDQ